MKSLDKRTLVLIVVFGCPLVITSSFATGAVLGGVSWARSEVTPIVLVKPSIGGFQPAEGSGIGNTWAKSEVKPVLLVKEDSSGFTPADGSNMGIVWTKADVIPVVLAQPSPTGFVPSRGTVTISATSMSPLTSLNDSAVESQIDGDFNGWEGETVIRLTNGQIWQQTDYHYEYHYAFMPKILIFKSGGGYKAKIDDVNAVVGVSRLK